MSTMWIDKPRGIWTLGFVFAISLGLIWTATLVFSGAEATREQAIDIAQQELKRATSDVDRYEVYVDEGNKLWQQQMLLYKASESELYRKYDSILKAQRYWTIFLIEGTKNRDILLFLNHK